ncbi:MAG: ADP-ribose pyrophosphatase [Actinobacteria bacterium]|nr:MAG: ADP-ribose pyrophosphatase [Actinomycetota bacterium]
MRAGVGAIVVDGGRVLLLRRNKEPEAGLWGIQGGAVEFGETVEAAARRELEEELGVGCEIVGLLGVTDHILPEEGAHWVSPVFLAKIGPGGTPRNAEPEKHSEIGWFDLDGLPEGVTLPTRSAVTLLRERRERKDRADARDGRGL